LLLFNLVVLLPTPAQRRDGSGWECPSRHSRAAPNRFTRSGPLLFREGGCHPSAVAPPKPLRADQPARQNGELDPRRVTAPRRRSTRRNRDLRGFGATSRNRVGSVRERSVVGLHRQASGSSRLPWWLRSPAWGPIQAEWGRACAAARRRGRTPEVGRGGRGRP
jgi:hypothetical protein